ncbi:MAG: TIGR02757 family protein [Chlorobi bacterium]|nr:TIGR02757 family protein [Chlorobiota bacterium]
MNRLEIKQFLDEKADLYNCLGFIDNDPVSIPHRYTKKQDIEIAGFLASTIAWGRRDLILQKANQLMELMDDAPYDFLINATGDDWSRFGTFYYRTFQPVDALYFLKALRNIYVEYPDMESVFAKGVNAGGVKAAINYFRELFFSWSPPERTKKHYANVMKGSAGKRVNMFLRWMVRNDGKGVDFGIWKSISPNELYLPLDVHSGNVARRLGILNRKQSDWKAVEEVTAVLREFDPDDPVKYDFALFGLGVNERF